MNRIALSKRAQLGFFVPGVPAITCGYRKVGRVRGMDVWVDDENPDFWSVDVTTNIDGRHKRVCTMELSRDGYSYHVDIVKVDRVFQGHGIAPIVYRYLMKRLGIMLQAGIEQSPGGRYIWNTLATYSDIVVVGRRGRRGQLVQLEAGEEGELEHEDYKIYDGPYDYYVFAQYCK